MSLMGLAQVPSVNNPIAAIAKLKAHFDVESIHELQTPYQISDLSLDPAGSNLIIVKLPETCAGNSNYHKSLKNIGTACVFEVVFHI